MTTISMLGVTGGAGATTLAALTAMTLDAERARLPVIVGHDQDALVARLGDAPAASDSNHEVLDAGRVTSLAITRALADGRVVLVAPASAVGDAAVRMAIDAIRLRIGDAVPGTVAVARVDVHGGGRPLDLGDVATIDIAYDPALALGVPVLAVRDRLRARTIADARRWCVALTETLT